MELTADQIQKYKVSIKPLSVNEAWRGRRFKTDKHEKYCYDLGFLLPKITLPKAPYSLTIEFGLSNKRADIDNPVKSFIDALQKKYGFNDCDIYELHVTKVLVSKGDEFVMFGIIEYKQKNKSL